MAHQPTALSEAEAAAERGDHTTALRLLKAAASAAPTDAAIAYRLGAEYAHLELFDAAEAEMARALASGPEHPVARFHLGLLQITRGRFQDALATWQALDALPKDHALRCYKQAFEHLTEDAFAPARTRLEAGLAGWGSAPTLDRDMRRLLDSLPA
ncbi:tetratricopeptide repeat protein [Denitromonas iodatirespirans]|uniref:Tetratricopeptide repeat protein n=1 Tax=Denitromonas iodatirespirans TaxID=2795389 RepID=A0A944D7B0_DENI1|nr:tetratricopeptide repeat protein [Denitromonas iodatirespirans]MBT0959836.1 tetratricopeptide repeat protein [Denitromonas iodatirespirans]